MRVWDRDDHRLLGQVEPGAGIERVEVRPDHDPHVRRRERRHIGERIHRRADAFGLGDVGQLLAGKVHRHERIEIGVGRHADRVRVLLADRLGRAARRKASRPRAPRRAVRELPSERSISGSWPRVTFPCYGHYRPRLVDGAPRPGASCSSPGATAIWLTPWVQARSPIRSEHPDRHHAVAAGHPLTPRCGPLIDTSESWPPAPLSKVKKRVLKPWHCLPPRPGLSSNEVK